ncbi:MAG: DUF6701 domain-containing protein [Pseudomonadota bacterium]
MKKMQLTVIFSIAMLLAGAAQAVTCTSVATRQTDWNKTNAWDATCGGQPAVGDNAIIAPGTNILADKNTNNVANVTINNTGTLTIQNGNTLSLSGNLVLDAGGTFVAQTGSTVSLTGTNQTLSGNLTFANLTLAAGTQVTLTGNIVINGTTNLTQASIASTCPNNFTVTNTAGTVVAQSCPLPLPVAEYRLDETSPGPVADASANALTGTAVGGITVGGAGKVCGSYRFNGTDAYVSVANNALLSPARVSVAAWVRHDSAAFKSWEAILAKGDTSYRMHLNGGCSLNTPTTNALDFGLNTGCATADVSSATVPVANQWYHVVGTYDGATLSLYIDGARVGSVAYAGSVTSNTFPLYIGANSQQANRFWSGDLDEVKVYSTALTAAQVSTIYANENAGKNWDGTARTCPSLIHHVDINAPTSGITLTETEVTITPHTAAHSALANAGTIVLSTDTGLGDWTLVTGTGVLTPGAANSGQATYTFGAGESSVTLGFTYQTAGTVVLGVADPSGADLLLGTPVAEKANSITFVAPAFVFTDAVCVSGSAFGSAGQTCALATWPAQYAGVDAAPVFITAVNGAGVPTALSTRRAQTINFRFGLSCIDPVANAGMAATFAGATLPVCTANGAQPTSWSPTVAVTFNRRIPSSNASYLFNYPDVGKVVLWMQNSATPAQVGTSPAFVSAPHHFMISAVTASPIKAGRAFAATVTAYNNAATPAVTQNFGKETTGEQVTLSSVLAMGAGTWANPALVNNVITTFTNGVATVSNLSWSEVGAINLQANLKSGSYLGSGLTASGVTTVASTFIPDHFDTWIKQTGVTPAIVPMNCASGLTCPANAYGASGMVYSGQAFTVQAVARNTSSCTLPPAGTFDPATDACVTKNYQGAYAQSVTLSDAAGVGAVGSLSNTTLAAANFANGVGTTASLPAYTFNATTAPTDVTLRASATISAVAVDSSTGTESGLKVVKGRFNLSNAYGSEKLPLSLTVTAQYCAAVAAGNCTIWTKNGSDSASSFDTATNLVKAIVSSPLTAADIAVAGGGVLTLANGSVALQLAAPNKTGSVDIGLNAPAYLMPSESGRATFGVYRGGKQFIYQRER